MNRCNRPPIFYDSRKLSLSADKPFPYFASSHDPNIWVFFQPHTILPQTYTSLPQTHTILPQTYTILPQTYIILPQTRTILHQTQAQIFVILKHLLLCPKNILF